MHTTPTFERRDVDGNIATLRSGGRIFGIQDQQRGGLPQGHQSKGECQERASQFHHISALF